MRASTNKFNNTSFIFWILIGIFVLLILIPISPANMPIASRDSGVFLYTGWRLLHGDIPYKDVWDQKPPIIFFLNALGLLISGNSRWGVWAIELISLYLAAFFGFKIFKKAFGNLAAIMAVFIWLFTLGFVLEGGNYTTEYALPLQFACIWLAWEAETRASFRWRGVAIGVLSGLLFFTKQNTIGIFIAILIYIGTARAVSRKWREMVRDIITIVGGFLITAVLVTLLFVIWGALRDFWSAAFLYNFVYITTPKLSDRVQSLYRGWLLLSKGHLSWFGLLGWSITLVTMIIKRSRVNSALMPLLAIGLIDLPLELGMIGLGGRLINHYFMAMLPAFSLFTAFFLSLLFQGISNWLGDISPRTVNLAIVLSMILSYPLSEVSQVKEYMDITISYQGEVHENAKVLKTRNYILNNTSPSDTILVLGAESNINFISKRVSPSKYVYQYPLNTPGYTTVGMVEEFLNAVIEKQPPLIVSRDGNWMGPEDFSATSPIIDELITEIQSSYVLVMQYGPWNIYGLSGKMHQ